MSAQQRVSNDEILEAMERWAWVLRHAAEQLRMDPKNLRRRLSAIGMGPAQRERMREAIRTGEAMGPIDTAASGESAGRGVYQESGVYQASGVYQGSWGVSRGVGCIKERGAYGTKKFRGVYPPQPDLRTIANVQTATAQSTPTKATEPETPKTRAKGPKAPRIEQRHMARIQRLKWVMSAAMQRDLDETEVAGMLLDEFLPTLEARYGVAYDQAAASAESKRSSRTKKERTRG